MVPNSSAVDMAAIIVAVSSVTRLTRLELTLDAATLQVNAFMQAAMFRLRRLGQSLQALTRLRNLELDIGHWVQFQPADMLHLSVLTDLTHLSVKTKEPLHSTITIAVLAELTALHDLTLHGLQDTCTLPVIGKLQGLTHLCLRMCRKMSSLRV